MLADRMLLLRLQHESHKMRARRSLLYDSFLFDFHNTIIFSFTHPLLPASATTASRRRIDPSSPKPGSWCGWKVGTTTSDGSVVWGQRRNKFVNSLLPLNGPPISSTAPPLHRQHASIFHCLPVGHSVGAPPLHRKPGPAPRDDFTDIVSRTLPKG